MAAPTDYEVDPSIAGDSGAGSHGDPWGDLQYALDQITRDATDGDRISVWDTADEALVAALDLTTYGTPTLAAPLIIRGMTSSIGDGGIGGISGAGSYSIMSGGAIDFVSFIDMHLHNSGAANIILLDDMLVIANCEVDNTTGQGIVVDDRCLVINCHVHNIGTIGIDVRTSSLVTGCTLENETNDFTNALTVSGNGNFIENNILDLDGASNGVNIDTVGNIVKNNSIFCSAGTGTGIIVVDAGDESSVFNNIIEGFSGGGGGAIDLQAGAEIWLYGFNAFYNNTSNLTNNADIHLDFSGNDQALGSSPFANAGADDFTVDTSVRALAYPTANYPSLAVRTYLDIGALQRQEPAGGSGGLLKHPGMAGGMDG